MSDTKDQTEVLPDTQRSSSASAQVTASDIADPNREVVVCVDAMGGDDPVQVVCEGVARALAKDPHLTVIVTGDESVVVPLAQKHDRVQAQVTTQVIEMGDHPAQALREKKDSSIVVGCRLLKEKKADAFFSAGSTGAILAAATLVTGRIKGVKRPGITFVIPSEPPCVFLDMGANADCKPEYLVQFAQMGKVYSQRVVGCKNPRIALLNIGSEDTKGSQAAYEAHQLLRQEVTEFVGNCEGTDLLSGRFDVIVTDGYTGNIATKTLEATAKFLMSHVKRSLMSSLKAKIGGLLIKDSLRGIKDLLNADAYGGAILLGVDGVVLIGHGHTNAQAVESGILASAQAVRSNLVSQIAEDLKGNLSVGRAQVQ